MTGRLPLWMQRWLGVDDAISGEGTLWTLEHSWSWAPWITLIFVVATFSLIAWLYKRERSSAGTPLRLALTLTRTTAIGIVLLMLAEWILSIQRTGLPYLVIAVDDSASMRIADAYESKEVAARAAELIDQAKLDSGTRLNLAKALLSTHGARLSDLEERYKLRYYAISDEARSLEGPNEEQMVSIAGLEANGTRSRLGRGVRAILNDFRGSLPAAIVLLTDGVTTEGESLADAGDEAWRSGVPIFSIGIGDDQPQRDLALTEVVVDDVVFSGDVINFEVVMTSTGLSGQKSKLTLRNKEGAVLTSSDVTVADDGEFQKIRLPYRPEPAADADYVDFDYVLELSKLPREVNVKNNQRSGRIRIYNKQIQVLLVQAYPNYEYRYLKEMLQRDETIKLHTILQDADPQYGQLQSDSAPRLVFPITQEELFRYDVIIFGDVNPSLLSRLSMQHLNAFVTERGGGVIFIAGPKFTPLAYRGTPLDPLFPVDLASASLLPTGIANDQPFVVEPTELGRASPPMQIGENNDDTAACWRSLPPLYWALRASDLKPAARVLAIHPSETDSSGKKLPIISIQYVGAGKVVFHATDETHRWRFRLGDTYFSRYWVQIIRYLSRAKLGQGGEVELTSDRKEYRRGDNVRFRVRFLDEEQSPAEDSGVSIMIEQPGEPKQTVVLQRAGIARGVFEGMLTGLGEGEYRAWVVKPGLSSEAATDFLVQPPAGEMENLAMNSAELQRLAKTTRGKFYRITNANRLAADLPPGRQVLIDSLPPKPLWNQWPLLLVFLSLLTTEWVLRKRAGML